MFELPPSDVSPDEARRLADEVLGGRAYAAARQPPSLRERIFDWIGERFSDLFNSLSSAGGRGIFAWVVIIGFTALIVFLLTRLLRNVGQLQGAAPVSGPTVTIDSSRSAEDWLAAAVRAESAQDWRQAIRCRHQALVTELTRTGVLSAGSSQTAGELQHLIAQSRPTAATPMQEATWLFKDTWYGWTDADAASSARFAALAAEVLRLSEAQPAAPSELIST